MLIALLCCLLCAATVAANSQRPGFDISAAWVARVAVGLENGISDEKLRQLLPFTVKFVLKQNPLTEVCSADLIPDRWRAASSFLCPKVVYVFELDFTDMLGFPQRELFQNVKS